MSVKVEVISNHVKNMKGKKVNKGELYIHTEGNAVLLCTGTSDDYQPTFNAVMLQCIKIDDFHSIGDVASYDKEYYIPFSGTITLTQ